jgi:hypothetical protein
MLGMDFLVQNPFLLQFSKRHFRWLSGVDSPETAGSMTMLRNWRMLSVQIQTQSISAVFDTGVPTTLIDLSFFRQNPQLFQPSQIVAPPDMLAAGFQVYTLTSPLVLDGVEFVNKTVVVADLQKQFGPESPLMFLGMNHITEFDWQLDFKQLKYRALKPL